MPSTDAFALGQSDLNGFLFADVGVEASGMRLSVLSALARLGVDPWQEAARLSRLPRSAAAEALAAMLAAMPASPWPLPAAAEIAARLVALLPARGPGRPDAAAAAPGARPTPIVLIVAILLFAILGGLTAVATWRAAPEVGAEPAPAHER